MAQPSGNWGRRARGHYESGLQNEFKATLSSTRKLKSSNKSKPTTNRWRSLPNCFFQICILLLGIRWWSSYCCLHPSFILDFSSWPTNKENQATFFSCHPPARNGLVRHPGHHWTQYAADRVSVLLMSHFDEEMKHFVKIVKGRKIWNNSKLWYYALVMNWIYIW